MKCDEQDIPVRPARVFPDLRELRVIALALHRQFPLPEALVPLEKDLAELDQPLHRIVGSSFRLVAVSPVIVTRRVDEGMVRSVKLFFALLEQTVIARR